MNYKRLLYQVRIVFFRSSEKRTQYLKKKNVFHFCGENVILQSRKIPLYPNLIAFHNNIRIAAGVSFITHDVIDRMLAIKYPSKQFTEKIGCIEIMDNVFIGGNSCILYNTRIGPNAIVAAGSVVTSDVPEGTVYGGVPAKKIGDFNSLVEKRECFSLKYNLPPYKETISTKLESYLWKKFLEDRKI